MTATRYICILILIVAFAATTGCTTMIPRPIMPLPQTKLQQATAAGNFEVSFITKKPASSEEEWLLHDAGRYLCQQRGWKMRGIAYTDGEAWSAPESKSGSVIILDWSINVTPPNTMFGYSAYFKGRLTIIVPDFTTVIDLGSDSGLGVGKTAEEARRMAIWRGMMSLLASQ